MSGIATRTKQFVEALDGLPTRLVDTRKTTPGHRLLEKYAVRVGGGHNHRFGLYDAVMIKDNHIKGAGSVSQAIAAARAGIPHTMKIEVEVEREDQLEEALAAGADIIMLDNMGLEAMKAAVRRIKSQAPHTVVEASGSVTLDTIRSIAATGVDVISVGRLTYSVQALDISLDLNEQKEVQR
jgi:nicotinate-nucleotide pyrophosphorylase (carboxylating)